MGCPGALLAPPSAPVTAKRRHEPRLPFSHRRVKPGPPARRRREGESGSRRPQRGRGTPHHPGARPPGRARPLRFGPAEIAAARASPSPSGPARRRRWPTSPRRRLPPGPPCRPVTDTPTSASPTALPAGSDDTRRDPAAAGKDTRRAPPRKNTLIHRTPMLNSPGGLSPLSHCETVPQRWKQHQEPG